ncbi:MAG: SH3 domain-containing protein [Chloroflexi bacterium]|nr:SH3 domain-containing protein [Chloroflexota bacterium]
MRAKLLALIIAGFVLCAVSSAQEYSIRANRGLNLRAAPSLTADIADRVTAGTIMRVVGASGSWLKISRGGNVVWLADWVNFSRIDDSAPTGSQQPSAPINNCCFVDRQCQSDPEWIAGYWAYQNGQCAAPAPAQPATPAQPAASSPATVNNCCYVDRQCQSNPEWEAGYWAYQNNQCRASASAPNSPIAPSRPIIEGSSRFVRHVSTVLDWLESAAPEWYNYVISGMDLIYEVPVPEQDAYQPCTALASSSSRAVSLESCWINTFQLTGFSARLDRLNTAEVLGHEACHVHTGEAGIIYEDEEFECHKPMMGITVALDPYPRNRRVTLAGEPALSVVRRFCREGFMPELYCTTIQRLGG